MQARQDVGRGGGTAEVCRWALGWWAAGALSALLGCGSDSDDERATHAAWAASPQDYAEALPIMNAMVPPPLMFSNQSLRQVLHLSAGGDALRVRVSNLFGTQALTVDGASVAPSRGGGSIDVARQVELSFDGAAKVTVPPGEERWSDLEPFETAAESDVAVTLFIAGEAPVGTVHSASQQLAYVAPGDARALSAFNEMETRPAFYWITGVDLASERAPRVIVAFGDSITDGVGSSVGTNQRYPNFLSRRLLADPALGPYSVVNAGISGNRVLNDVVGPKGTSRFRRDALGQTGVTDVVMLLGINDIGFGGFVMTQGVEPESITAGLASMIAEANAAGVRVFIATLLPLSGTIAPYYSPAAETKRQAVNTWIRANRDVAAVIDFDRAMQAAADPLSMSPAFDSGDHLHPNDQGYEAMANAIDLRLFD